MSTMGLNRKRDSVGSAEQRQPKHPTSWLIEDCRVEKAKPLPCRPSQDDFFYIIQIECTSNRHMTIRNINTVRKLYHIMHHET